MDMLRRSLGPDDRSEASGEDKGLLLASTSPSSHVDVVDLSTAVPLEIQQPEIRRPPRDRFHLCYVLYFTLGTGVLFPWNAFITAVDYFETLYPGRHVDRVFAVTYMLPNLVILGLLLVVPLGASQSARIYVGFLVYIACLLVIPFLDLDWVREAVDTESRFTATVAAVAITGLADGVAQGSVFGSASHLPPEFTQAVVSGTSVSGVVVSFLRIATKAVLSQDENGLRESTYLYFASAGLFCILCIASQAVLPKLAFRRYFDARRDASVARSYDAPAKLGAHGEPPSSLSLMQIMRSSWVQKLAAGLFLAYTVTLSIFPGVLAEDVESKALNSWYPILLITLFNVADFVGKSSPMAKRFRMQSPNHLFILAMGRTVFYALYAFAAFGPAFIRHDPLGPFYVSAITCCLGFSNGFLTANCLMEAGRKANLADAEKTEMLMVWFLLLGLFAGALLGWIWLI